jgi:hypothetical protein
MTSRSHKDDSKIPNVGQLLQGAHAEGVLSDEALAVLHVEDLGARIQAGLGVRIDDVAASEVLLVTIMPDDSGSIRFAGNTRAVREGHNLVLDALAGARGGDGVLVHTRYLNGHVLCPYQPLTQAVRMTGANYDPSQGTPLYDQTVVLLGTVLAKAQELADHGVPARTVTLIITDGADAGSSSHSARDVASLVRDMLRAECHVVAAMGVEDGSTDFHAVFTEMGIRPEWILTPGGSASEIRRAFQLFSRSAMQLAAGGAAGLGGLGGFGAN